MALNSSTFVIQTGSSTKADAKKKALLARHGKSVEKVVADAKFFSNERKRKLSQISDAKLRESAAR